MDRAQALDELPPLYAVALRLADRNADASLIAAVVDIPERAVDAFLDMARLKLDELLRR